MILSGKAGRNNFYLIKSVNFFLSSTTPCCMYCAFTCHSLDPDRSRMRFRTSDVQTSFCLCLAEWPQDILAPSTGLLLATQPVSILWGLGPFACMRTGHGQRRSLHTVAVINFECVHFEKFSLCSVSCPAKKQILNSYHI